MNAPRLKICFLANGEMQGGVATALRMLRNLHDPQRYELSYIWLGEGNLQREFAAAGVKSLVLPGAAVPSTSRVVDGRRRPNYLAGLAWLWRMASQAYPVARVLRRWDIDIIYTSEYFPNLVGGLAARMAGVKSNWHIHMVMSSRLLYGAAARIYSAAAARLADSVLCNSHATRKAFGPGPRARLQVLHNCISVQPPPSADRIAHLRTCCGAQPDDILIGTVCRISYEKGLNNFLEAARRVAAQLPQARFVVVGGAFGPTAQELERRLRSLSDEGELQGRVRFLGHRDDARDLYYAIDIVCATSDQAEGFNYSLLEAMAASRPVVASRNGAHPEIVVHGVTGLLYTPLRPDPLAAGILSLATDPALRARMGQAGQARFLAQFEASRMAAQIDKIYSNLLSDGTASSSKGEPATCDRDRGSTSQTGRSTVNKPVIAFLTAAWAGIDDNIRAGKRPGGVPSVARIWTECLARGYEVHVFITTFVGPDWPEETIELQGVRFHWIRMPFPKAVRWLQKRRLLGIAKVFSAIWQIRAWHRICRSGVVPDIIYVMRSTFALTGWYWARRTGAKVVLRQYGTWLYQFWGIEKSWMNRLQTLGEYLAMKLPMDLFIMTNDGSMGDKAAQLTGVPAEKFRFWINGVDKGLRIDGFDRRAAKRELGLPEESPVIMTLGRLAVWKRIDRIVDAMPTILRHVPQARLVIVGDGVQREALAQQAKRLQVHEAVHFVGAVPHPEIPRYLNMCDVFVMPNDLTNMCNTLIEALTCGCCVVTRDVGDTTTIAKHNVNAIVLNPGDPEQFAESIVALLHNPEKRRCLQEGAYRWAMEHFQTWDERMAMEVRLLDELRQPGPARRSSERGRVCAGNRN